MALGGLGPRRAVAFYCALAFLSHTQNEHKETKMKLVEIKGFFIPFLNGFCLDFCHDWTNERWFIRGGLRDYIFVQVSASCYFCSKKSLSLSLVWYFLFESCQYNPPLQGRFIPFLPAHLLQN